MHRTNKTGTSPPLSHHVFTFLPKGLNKSFLNWFSDKARTCFSFKAGYYYKTYVMYVYYFSKALFMYR